MRSAVVFKGLALVAALVNVGACVLFLAPEEAEDILVGLSAVQLLVPFAGFGLAQRFIAEPETRSRPAARWFVGSWLVTSLVAAALVFRSSDGDGVVAVLLVVVAALFGAAEYVRTRFGSQRGFVVANIGILVMSSTFAITGETSTWSVAAVLVPLAESVRTAAKFGVNAEDQPGTEPLIPQLSDIRRSVRVALINQYYNLIIVVVAGLASPTYVLELTLLYRAAIFLNWQTFYWLRIGHQRIITGASSEARRVNRRLLRINYAATAVAFAATYVAVETPVAEIFEVAGLNRTLLYMLILFGLTLNLENLVFPFEIFALYLGRARNDQVLLGLQGAGVLGIAAAAWIGFGPLVVVWLVEALYFSLRVVSGRGMGYALFPRSTHPGPTGSASTGRTN